MQSGRRTIGRTPSILGIMYRAVWLTYCQTIGTSDYRSDPVITIVLLRDVFHIGLVIGSRPADRGPITRPIWKTSRNDTLLINQSNISRDVSLQLSKCLADSDLVVIGLTGIGPIRKISILDWFLRIGPMKVVILYWQIWSYKG